MITQKLSKYGNVKKKVQFCHAISSPYQSQGIFCVCKNGLHRFSLSATALFTILMPKCHHRALLSLHFIKHEFYKAVIFVPTHSTVGHWRSTRRCKTTSISYTHTKADLHMLPSPTGHTVLLIGHAGLTDLSACSICSLISHSYRCCTFPCWRHVL